MNYLEKHKDSFASDTAQVTTILNNLEKYLYDGETVYIQIYEVDSSVIQIAKPIDIDYKINITTDLVYYLTNKELYSEADAATILRQAGYPSEKDVEMFTKIAEAMKNPTYDSSTHSFYWVSIEKEYVDDYYVSLSAPVLLPKDFFIK